MDTDTRFSFLLQSSIRTARHKSLTYEFIIPWNDSVYNRSYVSLSNTGSRHHACAHRPLTGCQTVATSPLEHLHRLLPKQTIMPHTYIHRHEKPTIPRTSISMSKKREAVHPQHQSLFPYMSRITLSSARCARRLSDVSHLSEHVCRSRFV